MSPTRRPLARLATALAAVSAAVLLTGCGDDAEPGSAASAGSSPTSTAPSDPQEPSASVEEDATVVDLEIEGGSVTPQGRSVEVGVGEPVLLRISSDVAGELHVHSTPEQDISFDAGRSEHELVVDRPGVVDVESHDLGLVLVRLEVR